MVHKRSRGFPDEFTRSITRPFRRPRPRTARRPWLETEQLEGRQLLSITIDKIPLPPGVVATSGLTSDWSGNLWFTEDKTVGNVPKEAIARITSDGVITEFPLPDGHASTRQVGLTLGPDGNLWFPEDTRIGQITPDGVITEFAVPAPSSGATITALTQLTVGSDNNLWFVESRLNGASPETSVDRITTDGVVTQFPAALDSGASTSLTLASDGNLYSTGSRFVRITPDGVVSRISLPGDSASSNGTDQALSVTVDGDGNLWVPYSTPDRGVGLAEVTPDGTVKDTGITSVQNLTFGPDGELWFSRSVDPGKTEFGHIATNGTVTTLATTISGTATEAATLGFDGNLWFTEQATGTQGPAFVRVGTDGTVTEFPIAQDAGKTSVPNVTVHGLTTGPDGNLWFVDPVSGSIGRVNLDLPVFVPIGLPVFFGSAQAGKGNLVVPEVTGVSRTGVGRAPTVLTLSFNTMLDPATAKDVHNYTLVLTGPRGHSRPHAKPIAIKSVVYDALTHTVSLTPAHLLKLNGFYRLTVNGASVGGVAGLGGTKLDGSGNGKAGSNFTALIHRFGVVTPKAVVTHPSTKHAAAAHVAGGHSRLTPHRLATSLRAR
jgi:virginiamycin B lyase